MSQMTRDERHAMYAEDLHLAAMEWCDKALAAKSPQDRKRCFYNAYSYEMDAASVLSGAWDKALETAVLYRSAATLATECGEYEQGRELAYKGLATGGPEEIAAELRDVLERIRRQECTPHPDLSFGEPPR